MAKAKKKKKRPASPARTQAAPPSRTALHALEEADALIEDGDLAAARDVLEEAARQRPRDQYVLTALADVYYDLQDMHGYQHAAERLLRVTPNDPDVMLGLAGAYLANIYPTLALRTFRRVLERWPEHERAAEIREEIARLEKVMPEMLKDLGVAGEEGLELAAAHEELRALLDQGSYAEARRAAEQLLRRWPNFAPALNNLSQVYALEGHFDTAIATAQRTLAFDPENVQALSNITRYHVLSGRLAEAEQWAARLKAVESDHVDAGTKKAEALSYLGDDAGVLAAFAAHKRLLASDDTVDEAPDLTDPLLYHLAAVAHGRLGQEQEARRLWARALERAPGLEIARSNLDDLDAPVDERHAPWPFPFYNWISRQGFNELMALVQSAAQRNDEEATRRAARRFLRQHPEITALVPLLLDRGDPAGREFALRLATLVRTPELLAALRDFALGQRGPTAMRQEAARAASEGGMMPAGMVRFWVQGEWREVLFLNYEIHEEQLHRHPPQVEEWHEEAVEALRAGDGKRAEQLLQQALAVVPGDPSLLNNLASALDVQGRRKEAMALLQRIFEEHPDYFFARIGMARLAVQERQFDRARELLQPLMEQRRLHRSEFDALCAANVELYYAEGHRDGARSWVDLWASVNPDHPGIARWRATLTRPGWLQRLANPLGIGPTA
ncbi:MAG TPA: tetratricopeptide repeat protein [Chloroflexota bacterium]|nr:tetratricopeptide repeat protein [Chloroflexota bacterium]